MNAQIQEAQSVTKRINLKIYSYACHKIQNTKEKEKIFKAAKEKKDRQPRKKQLD